MSNLFKPLENTRPFIKVALEGFAGSGKTLTGAKIALGIHKRIGSKKPIAVFDTERKMKSIKRNFDAAGVKVEVAESRTLADLSAAIDACENGFADIILIDSITHVWERVLDEYMTLKRRQKLQFQDWGIIKPKWKREFSDKVLMAKCHIIFTGRAGFEYEDEKDERGNRQIYKSGIKMKAESETAYEPDILILMERQEKIMDADNRQIYREAIVIKDNTSMIDGKVFKNPNYEDFAPAFEILLDGVSDPSKIVETPDDFETDEDKRWELKQRREIATEKIKGEFELMGLGKTDAEKQIKVAILRKVFDSTSWTEITTKKTVDELEGGAAVIVRFREDMEQAALDGIEVDQEFAETRLESILSN
jgi:hypothetical protein